MENDEETFPSCAHMQSNITSRKIIFLMFPFNIWLRYTRKNIFTQRKTIYADIKYLRRVKASIKKAHKQTTRIGHKG